jgi:methyl-accepting chemotaxis protein
VTRRIEAIQGDTGAAGTAITRIVETVREIHEIQNDLAAVLEEQSAIAASMATPSER